MDKYTNNNIILFLITGVLVSLFIFYMTDSNVYRTLTNSKEKFVDDKKPENYSELEKYFTEKIGDNIDKYLDGISTNMIEVKKRKEVLKSIDENLDKITNKLKYTINQNKLYNTNGQLV